MLQLRDDQRQVMKDACSRTAPREACGIVSAGVAYELPNRSAHDGTFHIISEDIQELASQHGLRDVDAIWHTHPSGSLVASEDDLASHPWPAALVIATPEAVRIYHRDPRPESDVQPLPEG